MEGLSTVKGIHIEADNPMATFTALHPMAKVLKSKKG